MSMLLAGASWAFFVSRTLARRWWLQLFLLGAAIIVLIGQSLTAGRAGYVTWAVVGLALCLVRWKRYLVVAPFIVAGVITFIPGVSERMTQGFTEETRDTNARIEAELAEEVLSEGGTEPHLYTVTSGRIFAWPFVVDKIWERPLVGYGKQAMIRTGLAGFLMDEFGEGFPHPHNAYLELLLDTGILGFMVVVPFYLLIFCYSVRLFHDSRSPFFTAIGGVTVALVLALLVASMGSQTFYPREGSVGMWCAIGLMLRVWVERGKAAARAEAEHETTHTAQNGIHHSTESRGTGRRGAIRGSRHPTRHFTLPTLDKYLWETAA